MMTYRQLTETGEEHYKFSYSDTKFQYEKILAYSDLEFAQNIIEVLHTACFICFMKEIPSEYCLRDTGIIHELIHLMHFPSDNAENLGEIRKSFETWCRIA